MLTGIKEITDVVMVVLGIVGASLVGYYVKNKVSIDKKAQEGDNFAKATKYIASHAQSLVYQAEKNGGSGDEKLNFVINAIDTALSLAHLPNPGESFIKGEIEKSVKVMKSTSDTIDVITEEVPEDEKNLSPTAVEVEETAKEVK
ncbi:phage holin [Lactobacillus sp.]|uniref:phage holin n=1 Tax=Lactobacillus sp. TaxID=1591 RepID=UPI001984C0AA|nr:phage holin [Lactobacillus sp.]MBD5430158.1 phage holin [Lactobacillus sp.]